MKKTLLFLISIIALWSSSLPVTASNDKEVTVPLTEDSEPDYVSCYANRKYYNAINFNGHTVKCTACDDLYDCEPKGELLADGTIRWRNGFDELYQSPTFENEMCLACNKLPICMGLCPRNHVNGAKWCKEDALDSSFEESIIDYIDRSYL